MEIAQNQFDDYIADNVSAPVPVVITQIDLNPYHDIIPWDIVNARIAGWKVFARTDIYLEYDNFAINFNRNLKLTSLGSQYDGSNNIIISTWTTNNPVVNIFNNHTRFPNGTVNESGNLNHKMKAEVKLTIPLCGEITIHPGLETTKFYSNTLTVNTQ